MSSSLDPEVLDLVEMSPVEDVLLGLLRERLTGVKVGAQYEDDQIFPSVLIRRDPDWGDWRGDPRFLDAGQVSISTLCNGLNADEDSALLAEAVRVILRDSTNVVVPSRGHVRKAKLVSAAHRVSDWATSTGPVQFANLPADVIRYQATYHVEVRKPLVKPFPLP